MDVPDDTSRPAGPEVNDPRPIQGLLLTDVWEHNTTKELDYRPTKTGEGYAIAFLPESIRTGADARFRAAEMARARAAQRALP